RQILVPFDEARHHGETIDGAAVKRPYLVTHGRAVIVDQELAAAPLAPEMSGEMNFADRVRRNSFEVCRRVEAEVDGTHEDIVHVAQEAAAGPAREGRQELGLRDPRGTEAEIGGRILDEDRP